MIIKNNGNRRLRRDGNHPQRSYGRSSVLKLPHSPEARLCLGTRKRRTLDYCTAPFLKESRHRQMRISYLLSARSLMPRHPVRVLPQDLSADCYARYSVHLSSTEFQPHRLVSECIATKACTSSIQGISLGSSQNRPTA